MDFAAVIADLKTRLAGTTDKLAKIGEQRRPHALAAMTGDAEAKKAIEKIDSAAAAARSEADTLTLAIEEAEKRTAEHEAQIAAEDRRRREAEARAICAEILDVDRDFDQTAQRLHQSLVQREQLIRKLASLGVVYPKVIRARQRKLNVTAALVHAGLHRYADLNLVAPSFRQPLEETDSSLREPLMTKAEVGDRPIAVSETDHPQQTEVHP